MSRIILYLAASIDGYIATPDGGVSWLDPYNTVDYDYDTFMKGIGSFILGSRTYEQMESFIPGTFGKRPAFVVTSRTLPVSAGVDVRFCSAENPVGIASDAKAAAGDKDVWHMGGGKLASLFMRENLIDRIELALIPVVLGAGIPLWEDAGLHSLTLTNTVSHDNGVLQLSYTVS